MDPTTRDVNILAILTASLSALISEHTNPSWIVALALRKIAEPSLRQPLVWAKIKGLRFLVIP